MSVQITLARPYAKAIFNQAKTANNVQQWSQWLDYLELLTTDSEMHAFIRSPKSSKRKVADLLVDIADDSIGEEAKNLIELLAMNKRLAIVPDIRALFEQYRADNEGSVNVQITVAYPLEDNERKTIISALQVALDKKIQIDTTVDPTIIGGIVVRAGDQTIDGSVLGNLKRLEKIL
ncbi:MAG: F0F1 ATP synthase subunit delta [Methylococcales bacterium]